MKILSLLISALVLSQILPIIATDYLRLAPLIIVTIILPLSLIRSK